MFVNCNRHSSTLAWKIPWTEKLSRLYPMGSQRVGHDWEISLWFHCVWKIMTALFIYFKHYKSSGIFLTTSWLFFLEKSLENVHYQIMICVHSVQFSSVQSLSRVQLFATSWITAHQASLSITNSRSLLKLMSIESVMPCNHLILCYPLLLLPQSLPASGSFPMSQLFAWGGQRIGVSALASVLPMNIQDWSLLGWTGWISLQSKGLSRVFSNTTLQEHQFFGAQLSSQSILSMGREVENKFEKNNYLIALHHIIFMVK